MTVCVMYRTTKASLNRHAWNIGVIFGSQERLIDTLSLSPDNNSLLLISELFLAENVWRQSCQAIITHG